MKNAIKFFFLLLKDKRKISNWITIEDFMFLIDQQTDLLNRHLLFQDR